MKYIMSASGNFVGLDQGDQVLLYKRSLKSEPQAIDTSLFYSLIRNYDDVIEFESKTENDANAKFKLESDRSDSILLLSVLTDDSVGASSKDLVYDELEKLLQYDEIFSYLHNIYLSKPCGLITVNYSLNDEKLRTNSLINCIIKNQVKIKDQYLLFEKCCEKSNLSEDEKKFCEGVMVSTDFYYELYTGELIKSSWSKYVFDITFKLKRANISSFNMFIKNYLDQEIYSIDQEIYSIDQEKELDENFIELSDERSLKSDVVKKTSFSSNKAYESVKSQIEAIKNKLAGGKEGRALELANQLQSSQLARGDNVYASLSLCSISELAKQYGFMDLRHRWAKAAVDVCPDDYRAITHLAEAHFDKRDFTEAQRLFWLCTQSIDDNRAYGYLGLAKIMRLSYNYEEALNFVDKSLNVLSEGDEGKIAYVLKAEICRDSLKFDEAISIYKLISNNHYESSRGLCGLAAVYADNKEYKLSEETYREAINFYPDDKAVALSSLGFLLAKQGRFEEGNMLIKQCIEIQSDDIISINSLARSHRIEGKFINAKNVLETAQFQDQKDFSWLRSYISTLIALNELEEVESYLKVVHNEFGEGYEWMTLSSEYYVATKQYDEALRCYDSIKSIFPKNTTSLCQRAKILKLSGYFAQAGIQYSDVLDIDVDNMKARAGLKIINQIQGDPTVIPLTLGELGVLSTHDDYYRCGIEGLLNMAQGNYNESNKLLLLAVNSRFYSVNSVFSPALSLLKLKLKNTSPSSPVRNAALDFGIIQRAIVFLVTSKNHKLSEEIKKIESISTMFDARTKNVFELVKNKKGTLLPQDVEMVFNAQLNAILMAA